MTKTYSDKFLKNILQETKSIAVVGASSKAHRDSFKVMETLIKNGYIVYPVNPYEVENKILGMQCYHDLKSIDEERLNHICADKISREIPPCPFAYNIPRFLCAIEFPCSAASSHHFFAS